mgnify:CR=1 FL=1
MKISRNKIVEISQDEAVEIIKDNGRKQTVGVVHTKKDGILRTGSYRVGTTKGTNGKGLNYNPNKYNLIPVRDMHKGFRMIWEDGIKEVNTKKITYVVKKLF